MVKGRKRLRKEVSNFNQMITWHRHMKDHVEKDHLTKSDAVMLSTDQGMDLQTLFRIHTIVSNFLIASSKIILTPHFFLLRLL